MVHNLHKHVNYNLSHITIHVPVTCDICANIYFHVSNFLGVAGRQQVWVRAYSHQKRAFFSAAEILLRIYQNPIHLNGARWRTTSFRTANFTLPPRPRPPTGPI